MNIKTRLAVSSIITGVLALTIGVSFIMTSRVVAREEEESRNVRNLLKDLFELELVAQNYLAHRLDRAEEQWQSKYASISRQLEIMVLSHQDEENILGIIRENNRINEQIFLDLAGYSNSQPAQGSNSTLSSPELARRLENQLDIRLQKQVYDVLKLADVIESRIRRTVRNANLLIMTLIVLILVVIALSSLWIHRTIVRPISRLHEGTEVIGSGNFDYRVGIAAKDEIGQLSRAFDQMIDNLKETTASRDELEREIAERKQAEDRATRFGQILESSLNEIYIFDAETFRFVQVNRGARENLGYSMDELQSLTALDLKPEFSPESFGDLVEPLRAGRKEAIQFNTVHKRKDGSLYPVEVHLQLTTHESLSTFTAIILDITNRKRAEQKREKLLNELQETLAQVKTLSGLLPICASCKKIRDDKGYWNKIEGYIQDHSEAEFTHGICPECAKKLYPELYEDE